LTIAVLLFASVSEAQDKKLKQNATTTIVPALTDFSFDLYKRMAEKESQKNLFVSPLSISFALTMCLNGAAGETKTAMQKTLSFNDIDLESLNSSFVSLKNSFTGQKGVELNIANSLWLKQGGSFRKNFVEVCRSSFDAEVREIAFSSGDVADINRWVSAKTKGKIDKIIEQFGGDAVMMLLNAIYFKGSWLQAFNKKETEIENFYLVDSRTVRVPMMKCREYMMHFTGDHYQAVQLPYTGKRFSMSIFLPDEGVTVDEFIKNLTSKRWTEILRSFSGEEGILHLPKFKMEYETLLNSFLDEMGMGIAFDRTKADFTAMRDASERTYISIVRHKTFVDVNEEGTEAAAVTSVEVAATATANEVHRDPFRMIVERPFFFVIHDTQTKSILFMGTVYNPEGKK
jgi:serpin B